MITVLLADDHILVRRGFRRMLEDEADIEVVAEAGNGKEAVELAQRFKPNVIVMDYSMPVLDGVLATHEIRKSLPECAVLMLSMHGDENYIRNAMDAGARGYLLKSAIEVDLVAAVREVAAGKIYGVPASSKEEDRLSQLTPRERQILTLIGQGVANKDIADMLGLSIHTVNVHRANLMRELGIHRTPELVLYAVRHGLVGPS